MTIDPRHGPDDWPALPGAPRVPELAPRVRQQHEAIILEQLAARAAAKPAQSMPKPGRRRARRAGAGFAAALLAGVCGATAIAALSPQHASDPVGVRCFAVATKQFDDESLFLPMIVVDTTSTASDEIASNPARATELCSQPWEGGELSATAPYLRSPAAQGTGTSRAPELIACILPSGQSAVFPGGRDTCQRLGLPESLDDADWPAQ